MTDFRFVTTDLFEHNGVRMNLSPDKMWVNPEINVWQKAFQDFDAFWVERHRQAKSQPISVCTKYIADELLNLTEEICYFWRWEEILYSLSDLEKIDKIRSENTKSKHLRPEFIKFCEYFLNRGCVLLPLIGGKSEKVPRWHALCKPVREGEPYSSILKVMLDTGADSRKRIQKSAMRTVFSSISFDECNQVTEEVFEEFKKLIYF